MSKSSSTSGSWFSRAGIPIVVVGVLAVALATLTPSDQAETPESLCLVCGQFGGVDVLLNVLLLLPLGAGLALLRVRRPVAISSVFALTVCVELLQRYVIPGRDGSVGDVITNTIGGVLGYMVGMHVEQLLLPAPATAAWLTTAAMSAWMLLQWTGSYALMPSPTNSRYFGQLARQLGAEPAYTGTIASATLGGVPIPDWELRDRDAVAARLRAPASARVDVTVMPRAASQRPAAIVRIADAEEDEILLLGADGDDLLFSIRTHASDLSFRRPYYRLRGGHPTVDSGSATPLRLHGAYSPPTVELQAEFGTWKKTARMRLSSSQGWRLFALAPTNVDGSLTDNLIDAVWLLMLMLPAGYWGAFLLRGPGALRWVVGGVGLLLATVSGFAIGPLFYHLAAPSLLDVSGAAAGLLAGAGAATLARRYLTAFAAER